MMGMHMDVEMKLEHSTQVLLSLQETIGKQVARLYLWPQAFEVPVLDGSM